MTAGSGAGTQAVTVHVAIPRNPLPGRPTRSTSGSHHRIAVVAGRRIGNAVQRNRAKRRLRAIAHHHLNPEGHSGFLDIVVIAKPGIVRRNHAQLTRDVQSAFTRAYARLSQRPNTVDSTLAIGHD